ncbi:Do family serine endopeptidase [Alteripontixanthobacter maritimus]|uniref:Do family serine endopeptidase n=1 Tax=Alteripontixanthobacter maritimus TaxID=2161824 RepID=UPI001E3BC529|nr:Do family serine endopeptidase [Alteripontixanthobacter maritimus]
MRYVYGLTSALLMGGAAISLSTGYPAGAQVAQNDDRRMAQVVPRAGAPESFADLTEQLQPAVVNISTRQRVEVQANPFAGSPLAELFNRRRGQQGQQRGEPQIREGQSLGSGFFISADGYVVTNNHVVSPARNGTVTEITVTLPDGTEYEAELVGSDSQSDLAVLKVTGNGAFPFVTFGDSAQARVGDWVIAIGNPFGLGGTVTSGIVSSVLRNTGDGAYQRYIQTDASINRGNSGGPLFDMQGNVIGINNAIFSPSGGSVGIGFAIPSEVAAPIVSKLRAGEEISRGYLGIEFAQINDDLADSLGLEEKGGAFIQNVIDDGPASRAGLREGDVIVAVGGEPVTNDEPLGYLVANIAPGQTAPMTIIRNGDRRRINVTIGKRPSEEEMRQSQMFGQDDEDNAMPQPEADDAVQESLGLNLVPLTPQIARQLGVDTDMQGLAIASVNPNSDAARKGLQRRDIILSANYRDVATVTDLESVVAAAKKDGREAVLLRIRRTNGQRVYVPVRLR